MAKFFFNFRQGGSYQVDELGCEFANVEDAYLGAFTAAQDMWRELLINRHDPLMCAFEVMDEEGRDLFTLPLSEVLDVCRGRTPNSKPVAPRQLALQQALDTRQKAWRTLNDVSSTVAKTRQTLCETRALLAQVSKIVAE